MLPQNRLKGKERISVEEWRSMKKAKSKYRNRKVVIAGMTFDSNKEYRRWITLNILQREGHITNLERQVKYDLGVCNYFADFKYIIPNGKYGYDTIVEDVKGFKTQVYRLKKKLMKQIFDIDIKET